MSRRTLDFLGDIRKGCIQIIEYTRGLSRDQVFSDSMRFDAVLFNFHVIGEAVKHLPAVFREEHPDVPWRDIAGMRDVVAHAYFALDVDILWEGIGKDVPALLEAVEGIIEGETASDP